MTERKYPCQAKVKDWCPTEEFEGFSKPESVTVLTEAKCWDCCGIYAHAIEFPDGYPEPPEECAYWMIYPEQLIFEDEE